MTVPAYIFGSVHQKLMTMETVADLPSKMQLLPITANTSKPVKSKGFPCFQKVKTTSVAEKLPYLVSVPW